MWNIVSKMPLSTSSLRKMECCDCDGNTGLTFESCCDPDGITSVTFGLGCDLMVTLV